MSSNFTLRVGRTWSLWVCLVFFWALSGGISQAARVPLLSPVIVLRTLDGGPLLSDTRLLGTLPSQGDVWIQFSFGFATDEPLASGQLLDSLTLTLGENNGPRASIYGTADRSGTVWAPVTPGTVFLSPDSMVRASIDSPDFTSVYQHRAAYSVTAPVPAEFLGREVNFYSDLFNNGNSAPSLGWIGPIMVVPEPSTAVLGGLSLLLLVVMRRNSR